MAMKPLWERARADRPLGSRVGPPNEIYAFLVVLVTLASLTQWTAHTLRFHYALGQPMPTLGDPRLWGLLASGALLGAGGLWIWRPKLGDERRLLAILGAIFGYLWSGPLYLPFMFPIWWFKMGKDPVLSAFFRERALWGLGLLVVLGGLTAAMRSRKPRGRTEPDLAGSARWAETQDIEKAGFFRDGPGVVVGGWKGAGRQARVLRDCGQHHVFVQAPARSGKGVGIGIPTALDWPGHLVYSGKFAEIEALTRSARARRGPAWALSPLGRRDRYNPLMALRPGWSQEADIQALTRGLSLPGSDAEENQWTEGGAALLTAVVHWALKQAEPTLARCRALLAQGDDGLKVLQAEEDARIAEYPAHLLGINERTRSSYVSAAMAGLRAFAGDALGRTTGASDFDLGDLLYGAQPTTLYLDTSSEALGARALLRIFLRQYLALVTAPENQSADPDGGPLRTKLSYPVLMLLDEFPLFGKITPVADKLEETPGFGVRCVFVVQNLPLHMKHWHEHGAQADPIFAGCQTHITYGGTDQQTCRVFSEMLGKTTEHYTTRSDRRDVFEVLDRNTQHAPQFAARDLVTPDELRRLPSDQVIIIPRGAPPIRTRYLRYYEEERWKHRATLAAGEEGGRRPRLEKALDQLATGSPFFDFGHGAAWWLRRRQAAARLWERFPDEELPEALASLFPTRAAWHEATHRLELALWCIRHQGRQPPAEVRRVLQHLLWFLPKPEEGRAPLVLSDPLQTAWALYEAAVGEPAWGRLVPAATNAAVLELLGLGVLRRKRPRVRAWLEQRLVGEPTHLTRPQVQAYLLTLGPLVKTESARRHAWRWPDSGGSVYEALATLLSARWEVRGRAEEPTALVEHLLGIGTPGAREIAGTLEERGANA